jgi:hypothetical protein
MNAEEWKARLPTLTSNGQSNAAYEIVDDLAASEAEVLRLSVLATRYNDERMGAERRAEALDRALQSLTPGGSEFVHDPERCVAFVRQARAGEMEALKAAVRRAQTAEAAAAKEREIAGESRRLAFKERERAKDQERVAAEERAQRQMAEAEVERLRELTETLNRELIGAWAGQAVLRARIEDLEGCLREALLCAGNHWSEAGPRFEEVRDILESTLLSPTPEVPAGPALVKLPTTAEERQEIAGILGVPEEQIHKLDIVNPEAQGREETLPPGLTTDGIALATSGPYRGWVFVKRADGQWVTAAQLDEFSMGITERRATEQGGAGESHE